MVETLDEIDLRKLRGFKPLRELLAFHDNCHGIFTGGLENLSMGEGVTFEAAGFGEDSSVNLDTHVIMACRGMKPQTSVYRRLKTGEKTSDIEIASSWGEQAYLYHGSYFLLLLRRPRNHSSARENLVKALFGYEKVSLERRHLIVWLKVESLPVSEFRRFFGINYPGMAKELIWELQSAQSRTADELKFEAQQAEKVAAKLERLAGAISSY
ncbi:MAG: hypothetical protein WC531_01895 [Candidatus Paceibacterota bacterium]